MRCIFFSTLTDSLIRTPLGRSQCAPISEDLLWYIQWYTTPLTFSINPIYGHIHLTIVLANHVWLHTVIALELQLTMAPWRHSWRVLLWYKNGYWSCRRESRGRNCRRSHRAIEGCLRANRKVLANRALSSRVGLSPRCIYRPIDEERLIWDLQFTPPIYVCGCNKNERRMVWSFSSSSFWFLQLSSFGRAAK